MTERDIHAKSLVLTSVLSQWSQLCWLFYQRNAVEIVTPKHIFLDPDNAVDKQELLDQNLTLYQMSISHTENTNQHAWHHYSWVVY